MHIDSYWATWKRLWFIINCSLVPYDFATIYGNFILIMIIWKHVYLSISALENYKLIQNKKLYSKWTLFYNLCQGKNRSDCKNYNWFNLKLCFPLYLWLITNEKSIISIQKRSNPFAFFFVLILSQI